MARQSEAQKHEGRFAIRHSGELVLPRIAGRATSFDTASDAAHWATNNYRALNWEVVRLNRLWRVTPPNPN